MMYTAFGMNIESEFALAGLRPAAAPTSDLAIRWSDRSPDDGGGMTVVWQTRFSDGRVVTAEVGDGGEQRLRYGDDARFDITSDAATVRCAVGDRSDPSWHRFLLDTVLWWICLTMGRRALHASAIELDAGVYVFASHSGGGKTSLALELIRRGNVLFSDDVVIFDKEEERLHAQPGPPLMNVPFAAGDVSDFGTPLTRFEDQQESWVSVRRSAAAAAPIAGLVLLDRAPGLPLRIEAIEATVVDLLPHVWGLPHASDTARERFDLVSDIAHAVPVFRLSADLDIPPATLAACVENLARGRSTTAMTVDGSGRA